MNGRNYIVISPMRNEALYLGQTITSMLNQTHPPLRWVIVDDGSSDETQAIARQAKQTTPLIEVVVRADRGFRQSGIGVVEAFYDGFRQVEDLPWNYVVKMDGDLRLPPDYFERLIHAFEKDERLGICSGDIYNESEQGLVLDSRADPAFHVRGAAKMYRRACWTDIGGLPRVTGFDCVDNVKARMLGWDTKRIADLKVVHLRKTGSANGVWRNSLKDGRGANAIGYHPLFLLLKCVKRLFSGSPVGALGHLCGYLCAWFSDMPRIEDKRLIRYVRQEQWKRLMGRESIWQ